MIEVTIFTTGGYVLVHTRMINDQLLYACVTILSYSYFSPKACHKTKESVSGRLHDLIEVFKMFKGFDNLDP